MLNDEKLFLLFLLPGIMRGISYADSLFGADTLISDSILYYEVFIELK